MPKRIPFNTQSKRRLGLRSGGSLPQIREQVEQSTNSNNMDSGNASAPLSPTTSATSTVINTNLNPTDILAFIEQLPTFEGHPSNLDKFITSAEELLFLIRSVDKTPYGQLLLRAVRNKIVGKADDALTLCDTRLNWDDIKTNLKRLYTSKRTEAMILREIQTLPNDLTMGKLFYSIIKMRNELITIAKDMDTTGNALATKRTLYDDICLNAFIIGLKDPLRTIIRIRNPDTIEKAYEYGQMEQSFFFQNSNRQVEGRRRDNPTDRGRPYPKNNQQEPKLSNNNGRNISHQQTNHQQGGQSMRNQNTSHNYEKPTSTHQQYRNNTNTNVNLCNINDDTNFPQRASEDQSDS